LPPAPIGTGYYLLNSNRNDDNELVYSWIDLSEEPTEGILNQVSTWLDNQMENVAKINESNTFSTDQIINGSLTVNGSILQEGDNYVTHAEHVYTEDDYIILRDGA
jgi:hypothetical protein